ncbi:hypothetical protein L1987_47745 [Smallanthus sonchifolius]|uniref:Uncharacterized protein n=1 Tax=Smallanthus sonchifolius TaxID=185202 RepID=A0ACB9G584_9ASTR|nr:hypothetical protein L1987_47745 [Smallanthus sonchifolius]
MGKILRICGLQNGETLGSGLITTFVNTTEYSMMIIHSLNFIISNVFHLSSGFHTYSSSFSDEVWSWYLVLDDGNRVGTSYTLYTPLLSDVRPEVCLNPRCREVWGEIDYHLRGFVGYGQAGWDHKCWDSGWLGRFGTHHTKCTTLKRVERQSNTNGLGNFSGGNGSSFQVLGPLTTPIMREDYLDHNGKLASRIPNPYGVEKNKNATQMVSTLFWPIDDIKILKGKDTRNKNNKSWINKREVETGIDQRTCGQSNFECWNGLD